MIATFPHSLEVEVHASSTERALVRIERQLMHYDSITLGEMERVALLDRTDTKYLLQMSQLYKVLAQVEDEYRVLTINQTRLNRYRTIYLDTPDFRLYQQHHNGLRSRHKVRRREYLDSNLAYWEVKCKTNQDRTVKARLRTADLDPADEESLDEFIDEHTPLADQELEPKVWNSFRRITLVSRSRPERLTLDVDLEFGWGDALITLPGIAVAEVKQERTSQGSDFIRQMRRLGIRPSPFSKYCAGVYLLYDNVKVNNFKGRMRLVEKLIREEAARGYFA